jgi:S-adenosylhomocysteine hydrolase
VVVLPIDTGHQDMTDKHKVKDLALAEAGRLRIDWADARMPVMKALRERYSKEQPLKGMRIAGCLHVTKEVFPVSTGIPTARVVA